MKRLALILGFAITVPAFALTKSLGAGVYDGRTLNPIAQFDLQAAERIAGR